MVKLEVEEPQNEAPVAVDDQYTVIEDEILGVEALNGVLKMIMIPMENKRI